MNFVGRKTYTAISDNVAIGFTKLTSGWSKFTYDPNAVHVHLFNLGNLLDETVPLDAGTVDAPAGADGIEQIERLRAWFLSGEGSESCPEWMIGRRLITSWNERYMLGIEGLRGIPERLDIGIQPERRSMLFNIFEFDGVLIERDAQRPAISPTGSLSDIANTPSHWASHEELSKLPRLASAIRKIGTG